MGVSVEIEGVMCETERDFEVNMCSGECVSSTVNKHGQMEKQCSCCSATKTVERQVTVKCSDGSARSHTIEFVEECSCGVTKCEAEPQPEAPVLEVEAPVKPARGMMSKVPPEKSPKRPKRRPINGGDKLKI